MKAKQFFLEFVEAVLDIGLIALFMYYIVYLQNIDLARVLIVVFTPFAFYAVFFKIKIKNIKYERRLLEKQGNENEVLIYLSRRDAFIDQIMIIAGVAVIVLAATLLADLNVTDIMQIVFFLFLMLPWHYYVFLYKDRHAGCAVITRALLQKDEFVVYMIPVTIAIPAVLSAPLDISDVIQIFLPFFLMLAWRKVLYSVIKRI